MTLGQLLRAFRAESGLSMRDLAKAAGVSRTWLQKVEQDKQLPSDAKLKALYEAVAEAEARKQ